MRKITIRSGYVRKGPPSFLGATLRAATEASKAPFFAESHPSHNAYAETRENCPKNDFLAGAKISAARVTYPESSYTSYTFLSKRSKLVRS